MSMLGSANDLPIAKRKKNNAVEQNDKIEEQTPFAQNSIENIKNQLKTDEEKTADRKIKNEARLTARERLRKLRDEQKKKTLEYVSVAFTIEDKERLRKAKYKYNISIQKLIETATKSMLDELELEDKR